MHGLNVIVTIVNNDDADTSTIIDNLMKMDGVVEAIELTGGFDIIVKVEAYSSSEMSKILEKIRATEGIKSADSHLMVGKRP